ncbi:unnamed protein product [Calypogeia fissa]
MADIGERDWSFCLRLLSNSIRDTSAAGGGTDASDAAVLQAVKRLQKLCKEEQSADLVARVYPAIAKLFQRYTASGSSLRPSHGLILLAILQFFLDFGDSVLHDTDLSIRLFFRSCLSRLFADEAVAKATFDFLLLNKTKFLLAHTGILPQFFPLILKIAAWGQESLSNSFLELVPMLMGPSSFLPLFPALLDMPTLVLALERLEERSGSVLNSDAAARPQSPAPEALLALMDEAYTGGVGGAEAESGDEGDSKSRDETDALFADLLKDENEGLAERHWSFPGMEAAVQAVMGSTLSEKLKHAFKFTPTVLQLYFDLALRDVNDSLLCALLPIVFLRVDAMFPNKQFSSQARKKCIEFVLAAFRQKPHFIAVLKKPIMDRLGQPHTSTAKAELALQLCWAVGEYGGGGSTNKDAARQLFESLELVLYENLASSRASRGSVGAERLKMPGTLVPGSPAQARLLCFVVTAIAKIASYHRELSPRARVCLAKVARSHQVVDKAVWKRARDYLGLMQEPAICQSILGSSVGYKHPTNVQWSEGRTKAVANIPFYLLGEKEGPPFHDFRLSDILGGAAQT